MYINHTSFIFTTEWNQLLNYIPICNMVSKKFRLTNPLLQSTRFNYDLWFISLELSSFHISVEFMSRTTNSAWNLPHHLSWTSLWVHIFFIIQIIPDWFLSLSPWPATISHHGADRWELLCLWKQIGVHWWFLRQASISSQQLLMRISQVPGLLTTLWFPGCWIQFPKKFRQAYHLRNLQLRYGVTSKIVSTKVMGQEIFNFDVNWFRSVKAKIRTVYTSLNSKLFGKNWIIFVQCAWNMHMQWCQEYWGTFSNGLHHGFFYGSKRFTWICAESILLIDHIPPINRVFALVAQEERQEPLAAHLKITFTTMEWPSGQRWAVSETIQRSSRAEIS